MRFLHLLLVPALLGGVLAQSGPAQACTPRLVLDDPKGDVMVKDVVGHDAPPADILQYSMSLENGTLTLSLTLAERPGGRPNEHFRYWLGFEFETPKGSPEYMDVRVAQTATYSEGTLVGPNSMQNPILGKLPAAWNGTTMTFRIPSELLAEKLGEPLSFGSPRVGTDGVHLTTTAQGSMFAAPYVQDWAYTEEAFSDEFQPLRPCASPPVEEAGEAPEAVAATPMPLAVVLVALLLGVGLKRRGSR